MISEVLHIMATFFHETTQVALAQMVHWVLWLKSIGPSAFYHRRNFVLEIGIVTINKFAQ